MTLAFFIYITGIATLFCYALGSKVHEKQLAFFNAGIVGVTTFYSSVPLVGAWPFMGSGLKFAFSTAFNLGSTRHAIKKGETLVDVRKVLVKNISMNFLAFILNVAYSLV